MTMLLVCKKPQSKLKSFSRKIWQKQAYEGTWKCPYYFVHQPYLAVAEFDHRDGQRRLLKNTVVGQWIKWIFFTAECIQFFITNLGFSSKHLWSKSNYILQWKTDFLFHNFFLKKVFCGISYIYICLLMTKSWMRNDNAISVQKTTIKIEIILQ